MHRTSSSLPLPAGVFIVDKPTGVTSHDVVDRVRQIVGMRRVGHAGTLDPAASGVLVVAYGQATRFLQFVASDDKAYDATVRLGIRTDTHDLEGRVVARRDASQVSELDVRAALAPLEGTIQQVPPMYSAIKVDGEPLYRRARRGDDVLRAPREITVHELSLLRYAPPDVFLRVVCSKGTYIRSLAESIGEHLGCGAVLSALRRTSSGRFSLDDAAPLDTLTPEHARDLDFLLDHLDVVRIAADETARFRHGQPIPRPGESKIEDHRLARVHDPQGTLLGVGEVQNGKLYPRKVRAST